MASYNIVIESLDSKPSVASSSRNGSKMGNSKLNEGGKPKKSRSKKKNKSKDKASGNANSDLGSMHLAPGDLISVYEERLSSARLSKNEKDIHDFRRMLWILNDLEIKAPKPDISDDEIRSYLDRLPLDQKFKEFWFKNSSTGKNDGTSGTSSFAVVNGSSVDKKEDVHLRLNGHMIKTDDDDDTYPNVGTTATASSNSSCPTVREDERRSILKKRQRALTKKLKQINDIKERCSNGGQIEANQLDKLNDEKKYMDELEEVTLDLRLLEI